MTRNQQYRGFFMRSLDRLRLGVQASPRRAPSASHCADGCPPPRLRVMVWVDLGVQSPIPIPAPSCPSTPRLDKPGHIAVFLRQRCALAAIVVWVILGEGSDPREVSCA